MEKGMRKRMMLTEGDWERETLIEMREMLVGDNACEACANSYLRKAKNGRVRRYCKIQHRGVDYEFGQECFEAREFEL